MQAYEFEAVIEKGNIHIPDYLVGRIEPNVKVIVFNEERPKHIRPKKFGAMTLDTRGFKFDRDEANER
jgi:hypothetical protein